MAEADKDQKTEEPTDKKLRDARQKGEVASAPEMRHAAMFLAAIVLMGGAGSWTVTGLRTMLAGLWGNADAFHLDPAGAQNLMTGVTLEFARVLMPLIGILLGCALLIPFLQGKPSFSWSRVRIKWSKLSPVSGLSRVFGKRALVEFLKTLAKFAAIVIVALIVIWPKAVGLDQLVGVGPEAIGTVAGEMVYQLVKAVGLLVFVIAGFDFFYQRRAFIKKMRMTLQEVKDEFKQTEGDPKIKSKIRSLQMQRARSRMMAAVPTASVIVTNPTHYSVALKYEHGEMAAPIVVAKGVDAVAMRIREIATESRVPIVESPPLARALFASVDIDHPVPVEHYAAVAEIIGYVMKLARRAG